MIYFQKFAPFFREYLATFKKTVAMHEVFLQRLAAHPVFRKDTNFRVFLEYENEVNWIFKMHKNKFIIFQLAVRGRNKKEVVGSFFKRFTQSADEVLLSGQVINLCPLTDFCIVT